MKLRILIFFSALLLCFAACKKDPVNAVTIEHAQAGDSLLRVNFKEEIILNPKVKGKVKAYQWLEEGKEVGANATYKFSKETPGLYTLVFKVVNEGGESTLTYKINVVGAYGNGILMLSNSNEDGDDESEISYIDEKGVLTKNVFGLVNKGQLISAGAIEMHHFNNRYYITSPEGPNHIAVVDDQSLKLDYTITQTGFKGLTYFSTADGKTGYANVNNARKSGLYAVDLTAKNISATLIAGTKDVFLLPVNTFGNVTLMASRKQLLKIENNVSSILNTYKENVTGAVKTANKEIWVGIQASGPSVITNRNKAKFIKFDQNFKAVDSVELAEAFTLPPNGILTASGKDNYIYWQETSTGLICRFNTATKTAETFVDNVKSGIMFATAWKINPNTGDVYIIDTPGLFSGEMESNLFIFEQTGKFKKEFKKVGYSVVDIAFPK